MSYNIPYGKQYIDEEDINAVINVLKNPYLTTGPNVKKFEDEFASYVGAKYSVAVANGTAALHIACLAAGLENNDEVITSPITFAASANCALYVGAKPVFADIDEITYNIDPKEIEKKITNKTKAIIPVHYTGLPCELEEIKNIAQKNNLIVIEDACHALGAKYKNSKIGDCTYSSMTVFSFHPVKHITTGEGGIITTNSEDLYKKLLKLRSHGISRDEGEMQENHGGWYYEMQELGFNYRITDFQCALGLSQLNKADWFIERRQEIAARYNEGLKDLSLVLPFDAEHSNNAYHLYVVKIKDEAKLARKELYDKLKTFGIHCQVHYIPVHTLPYYRDKLGYKQGILPKAEAHYERILSLPMYPGLTTEEQEYVITKIKELL